MGYQHMPGDIVYVPDAITVKYFIVQLLFASITVAYFCIAFKRFLFYFVITFFLYLVLLSVCAGGFLTVFLPHLSCSRSSVFMASCFTFWQNVMWVDSSVFLPDVLTGLGDVRTGVIAIRIFTQILCFVSELRTCVFHVMFCTVTLTFALSSWTVACCSFSCRPPSFSSSRDTSESDGRLV